MNFRLITEKFFGVPKFRKFTLLLISLNFILIISFTRYSRELYTIYPGSDIKPKAYTEVILLIDSSYISHPASLPGSKKTTW